MNTNVLDQARFNVRRIAGRKWLLARENGANTCRQLETWTRALQPQPEILVIDFGAVEAMTFSFADEFIGRYLGLRASRLVPETGIVLTGLNADTLEEVDAVLRHRDLIALSQAESGTQLLSTDNHLRDSYQIATLLRCFSAAQLGERLGISPQNANNRLKRLNAAGAVIRSRTQVDRGGKEFNYTAVQ